MYMSTNYGTNHPQLKWHMCVCAACATCAKAKNMHDIKPCVYTCVKLLHHTHTLNYPYEVRSIYHETIYLTTSSALNFTIYIRMQNYSWWNGYQYTGTPLTYCICSRLQLARQLRTQLTHITIASYICGTYILHFSFQASAGD